MRARARRVAANHEVAQMINSKAQLEQTPQELWWMGGDPRGQRSAGVKLRGVGAQGEQVSGIACRARCQRYPRGALAQEQERGRLAVTPQSQPLPALQDE